MNSLHPYTLFHRVLCRLSSAKTPLAGLAIPAMLLGLPLLGVALAGYDVHRYAEFPPLTEYVDHAPFSWPVFVGLALFLLAAILPVVVHVAKANVGFCPPPRPRHPFPWWGGLALIAGLAFWALAWTRFPAFAPFQAYTFSPLWFSYIVAINALTQWRTGQCSLVRRPGFVALLFVASAAFWWFFEYLNRFAQNWVYQNVDGLSPLEYFYFATLPFSTVLPAVWGTYECLLSFPRLSCGTERFIALRPAHPRIWAGAGLAASGAGLLGIGIWPDFLFPLLWISPFVIIACIQSLRGHPTLFTPLRDGFWRDVVLWALAALVCGLFWEMWNWKSLARWVYRVPFVHRFCVFEMPVLGYAGYLTFGFECAIVGDAVRRWHDRYRSPAILRRPILRVLLALLAAALVWLPFFHVFFKPPTANVRSFTPISPLAAALADRQTALWETPELRRREIRKMRGSNAEWDFMARTYFVLALANVALREPARADASLAIVDAIIDETLRLEKEEGFYYFLMDYARHAPFRNAARRSLFQDGEIALMIAARRMAREKDAYRTLLDERLRQMERQLRETPLMCGESYPNECWTFCNAMAISAFRMAEALDGADYSNLVYRWLQSIRKTLVDPTTGLLCSSFTLDGEILDGPEGSSIWMVAHCLQLVDPDFAADQYRRARRELGRTTLGFGWAKEWPTSWIGPMDVDSGPIIPVLGISPSSSGLALVAAAAFDDKPFFEALTTSLNYGGLPVADDTGLRYAASNPVGDAVILYAMVLGPLWEAVEARAPTRRFASRETAIKEVLP